jgi:hypothetical protein
LLEAAECELVVELIKDVLDDLSFVRSPPYQWLLNVDLKNLPSGMQILAHNVLLNGWNFKESRFDDSLGEKHDAGKIESHSFGMWYGCS